MEVLNADDILRARFIDVTLINALKGIVNIRYKLVNVDVLVMKSRPTGILRCQVLFN